MRSAFQPYTYSVKPGIPLLVLSCSEVKAPAAPGALLRFADLYDGPMWRQVKCGGYPLSNVAAISALYGYLAPGHPIETYNIKMDEERSQRMCGTGSHVAELAAAIETAGAAYIVGGSLYQELARTALRYRPRLAPLVSFASGSYLQQRKALGEFLRFNVGASAPVSQGDLFAA